jgi:ABC-type sugar transport system ATPase subunit
LEILGLSDTIAVMFRGKIVGQFEAGQANEKTLGLLMMGEGLEDGCRMQEKKCKMKNEK